MRTDSISARQEAHTFPRHLPVLQEIWTSKAARFPFAAGEGCPKSPGKRNLDIRG